MKAQELIDKTEIPEWDKKSFKRVFYPELKQDENSESLLIGTDLMKIKEKGLKQNARVRERVVKKKRPSAEELIKQLETK